MKKANELPVGTYAIGYGFWDNIAAAGLPNRRRGSLRAHGQFVTVYLVDPNTSPDEKALEKTAEAIAHLGLLGLCSHGVWVLVVERDKRTDDVRLLNRFEYHNKDGFPSFCQGRAGDMILSARGDSFPVLIGGGEA